MLSGTLDVSRPGSRISYHLTPELLDAMGGIADEAEREAWVASVEAREDLVLARELIFSGFR